MDTLMVEMSAKGRGWRFTTPLPQTGVAVCTRWRRATRVTLYAEPDESTTCCSIITAARWRYWRFSARGSGARWGKGRAALEGWMPARDLTYGVAGARRAHVVRWYTAEGASRRVFTPRRTKTRRCCAKRCRAKLWEVNGIGTDGWMQLSWYDNEPVTGFARLGDDTELGKPMRAEVYHVNRWTMN